MRGYFALKLVQFQGRRIKSVSKEPNFVRLTAAARENRTLQGVALPFAFPFWHSVPIMEFKDSQLMEIASTGFAFWSILPTFIFISKPEIGDEVSDQQPNSRPSRFENINSLIKNLSWPIFAFIVFFYYRDPLSQTIAEVPNLFKHAQEVKVGSVTLTVEKEASQQGNPELAAALRGLSPDTRKLLLEVGYTTQIVWSKYDSKEGLRYTERRFSAAMDELSKRGLISFQTDPKKFAKFVRTIGLQPEDTSESSTVDFLTYKPARPLTAEEENLLFEQSFKLTDLGRKAFDLIVQVVVNS